MLEAEGIEFRMEAKATGLRRSAAGAVATVEAGGRAEELEVSHVLVATGRTPNTDRLGLDAVGVALGPKGMVEVDERLRTSVRGIWACGDIRGGPMFTHTAWDDYRVLKSQMLGDGQRTTADRIVPYAMFTDPELGRVGLTESAAREAGIEVAVARFELEHNGKARESGETAGFIKVVADARTKRLVGAALVGAQASELVHLLIDVMNADAPYSVIVDAIHIHPTLAEAVQSAVASLDGG
jgi:pyruvate/2-oxoglutarate dehydrogenase complex dihydrolipoamide dehydrogenase (E3) component